MALKDNNDNWVYEEAALRDMVNFFYTSLYTSAGSSNSFFVTACSFPAILMQDMDMLRKDISIEETKRALFSMQNLKASGPEGFHPLFFKSQWEVLGCSLYEFVKGCFEDPRRIQEVNNTLVTLIPKCDVPFYVS